MTGTLLVTALLMGLAGGPHCLAMCAAPCAGVTRIALAGRDTGGALAATASGPGAMLAFQLARVGGYALAGALAAGTMALLGQAADRVAALRPLWALMHAGVLAWALVLLATGRQPLWSQAMGRRLLDRLRGQGGAALATAGGAGALWVLMPCGLLYSALMLAALASGPLEGALAMGVFAAGSGAWLALAPWLWRQLRDRLDARRQAWGTRLAGLALAALSVQALWHDVARQVAVWCA